MTKYSVEKCYSKIVPCDATGIRVYFRLPGSQLNPDDGELHKLLIGISGVDHATIARTSVYVRRLPTYSVEEISSAVVLIVSNYTGIDFCQQVPTYD